ncbi:hypothetical protein FRC18_012146 [Serendipita sp. 400]|nr:hypothetical protein FRC18_012146 [Serendipita sp. 400]
MSSPEDIIGRIADFVQWVAPSQPQQLQNHRAIMAAFDPIPVTSNIIIPFSRWEYVGRNPTLAAPFNIKEFVHKCIKLTHNHAQIYILLGTLALTVLVSTGFVALVANMITPNSFRHSSAWRGMKTSPLTVLFLVLSMIGRLPIVQFFPELSTVVHHDAIEHSSQYQGAMAQVLVFLLKYEAIELAFCLLVTLPHLFQHVLHPKLMGFRWSSFAAWIVRLAIFGLQLWFTRVSVDTTTSPVQTGTYLWTAPVWSPLTVQWTEKRFQTEGELGEDSKIVMQVFVALYSISSTFVWLLARKGEVYIEQRAGPESESKSESSASVTETSDVCAQHPTDGPCFNADCPRSKESMESWVPKSFMEADQELLAKVQQRLANDTEDISIKIQETVHRSGKVIVDMNREMHLWRKRHSKAREMDEALREFRNNQFTRSKDLDTIRAGLDTEHSTVDQLRVIFDKEESARTKRVAECTSQTEQKNSELVKKYSELSEAYVTLKKSAIAYIDALKELEAKKLEASVQVPESTLVSRGTDNVSATTLESKGSKGQMRTSARDIATSSDVSSRNKSAKGDRKQKSTTGPTTSAEPVSKEIGGDIWSRVQEFEFRSDQEVARVESYTRRHFSRQERRQLRASIEDFMYKTRDKAAIERARKLLKDVGQDFRIAHNTCYLPTFLDMAEMSKPFSDSRLITELGPHAISHACGISPRAIGAKNVTKCDWGTYIEDVLPKAMKNRLKELRDITGQDQDPLYTVFFKAVLERYIGTRPEIRTRQVTYQKPLNASAGWDYELIARRFLENLGLIQFCERPWESPITVPVPYRSKFVDSLLAYTPDKSTSKSTSTNSSKSTPGTDLNANGATKPHSNESNQSKIDLGDSALDSDETTSTLATPIVHSKAVDPQQPPTVNAPQDVTLIPVQKESDVSTCNDGVAKAHETQITPVAPAEAETATLPRLTTPKSEEITGSSKSGFESTLIPETKSDPAPNAKSVFEVTVAANTVAPLPRPLKSNVSTITHPATGNAVSVPWGNRMSTAAVTRRSTTSAPSEPTGPKEPSPAGATSVLIDSKAIPHPEKKDRMSLLSGLGNPSSKLNSMVPDSPPLDKSSLPLAINPIDHAGFLINQDGVNVSVVDRTVESIATDRDTDVATTNLSTGGNSVKPPPSNDSSKPSTTTSVFKAPTAFNNSQPWPNGMTTSFPTFSTSFAVPEVAPIKTGTNFRFDLSTQFDFSPTTVRKPSSTPARKSSGASDPFSNTLTDSTPITQPAQPTQPVPPVQSTTPSVPPLQPNYPTQSTQTVLSLQSGQPTQPVPAQPIHSVQNILAMPTTLTESSIPSIQTVPSITPVQSTNPFPLKSFTHSNNSLPLAPNAYRVPPALPYPIRPIQPAPLVEPVEQGQSAQAVLATSSTEPAQFAPPRPDWRKEALANSAKTNTMVTPMPAGQSTSLSVTSQMSVRQSVVNLPIVPPVVVPLTNASSGAGSAKPDWRRESLEDLAKKASFAADLSSKSNVASSWASPSSASPNKPRPSKRKSHGESRRNPV